MSKEPGFISTEAGQDLCLEDSHTHLKYTDDTLLGPPKEFGR